MNDFGTFKVGTESQLAGFVAAKARRRAALPWLPRLFETRWAAALGRSRSLCAVLSVFFHLTILLLFLIHLPRLNYDRINDIPAAVPVELVTIGDETNLAAMVRRELPMTPTDQQTRTSVSFKNPQTNPTFEMKLFPAQLSEQPKPVQDDGGAKADNAPPVNIKDAKVGDHDSPKIGAGTGTTVSITDLLFSQILPCWRYPKDIASRIVVFELSLDGSGAIERPPSLVEPKAQTPEAIAAVESVRQAIYTCAPYRLPAERFTQWRHITLSFDPKMLRNVDKMSALRSAVSGFSH